jgi:hypothetical protein
MAAITARLLNDTGLSSTDLITSIDALVGTGNPGALVTFTIGGVTIGTTSADPLGNWTFTPSGLADGKYKIVASEPGSSTSLTFTLDTTAPVVTERLVKDTGASSTDNITSTAGLTGIGSAGGVVTLTEGTTVLGTVTVSSSGTWNFTPTKLAQGTHTIVDTETDVAGNIGTTSLTFTLDTVAPVVTERLLNDTGTSATDNVTADPTLTGTGEAHSVVTLRQGTTVLGTTTADASGNWTFTPTGLTQGKHTIVASDTDVAGNTGTTSLTFTLDSAAPAVTEHLATDTGASSTDNITSNPVLTGGGNANAVVTLTEGATVLGTATASSNGTWNFTPTKLAQGTHTIVATETDVAGNIGTTSLTFTLDTVAPVVTEALANDTGTPGDNITSDPTLTGTADPGGTVALTEGTTALGSVTADATGHWTFAPTNLAPGPHTVTASDTDIAGNFGTASLTFTLDSVAPAVSEKLVSDTGASSTDNITASPALTGDGDPNATVTLTLDGTSTFTTTANSTGAWTFTSTGLTQGAHTIVASETNIAGNTGTASLTFTLDTVAPVVTEALANDTGTPGDNITSDPTLTGIADPGGTVALTEGTTALGSVTADATGQWNFVPTNLAPGPHTITASDTDLAGNTGTTSLTFTLQSGRTITSSIAGPVLLSNPAADNPLVITSTGAVNSTAAGVDGVDGTTAATWTVANDGTVASAGGHGISLAGAGIVSNGPTSGAAASISGSVAGIGVYGAGTVTNSGSIAGNTYGVALGAGGSVTNNASASVSSSKFGIRIQQGIGTVTNAGSITAPASGADLLTYGVALNAGGQVTNAGYILGGEDGIIIQGGIGGVTNSGRIAATVDDGVALFAGGSVTNAAGATISSVGSLAASVFITGAAGTVINSGSIAASSHIGVLLSAGGNVANALYASISGYGTGVFVNAGSATLTNSGSISATGTDSAGVYLEAGGIVTNNASGAISGQRFGVFTEYVSGTVVNLGRINAALLDAVVFGEGGSLTNAAGGYITGGSGGVYAKYRAAATVTNSGSIGATAAGSAGIFLADGGAVTNNTAASITGASFGVFITGALGTATNSGTISATKYDAVALGNGGSVTNTTLGSIVGGSNGVYVQRGGAVTNQGTISALGAGAAFALGGSLINSAGGSITGGSFGIFSTGAASTITNDGVVAGAHAIGIEAGGQLTNDVGATVSGTIAGVFAQGGPATISNAGSVSATAAGSAALDIEAGGSITNNAAGAITGASFGVFVTGGSGTVTNAGSIAGTNNVGVDLSSGGSVSNAVGASISAAGFGVALYGSGGTVTNAGTITGSVSSVHFGGTTSNNRLVVDPGAVFNGKVDAGGSGNTLELAQGPSAGSIGGIGNGFTGFDTAAVDVGATWTLTGANTAATVLNNGTLAIAAGGSLDLTAAADPASAGLFVLNANSLLEVAADVGSGNQMSFLGASEAIIDAASLFGTNVGQSTYTGPLLEDFGSGDSIDLKDVSFAAITLDYTSATGVLQVASSGSGAASLLFQTASLGAGTFHAAADSSGHTLITLA